MLGHWDNNYATVGMHVYIWVFLTQLSGIFQLLNLFESIAAPLPLCSQICFCAILFPFLSAVQSYLPISSSPKLSPYEKVSLIAAFSGYLFSFPYYFWNLFKIMYVLLP